VNWVYGTSNSQIPPPYITTKVLCNFSIEKSLIGLLMHVSYKFQTHDLCLCEYYELMKNEFHTVSIIESLDTKFVM